MPRPSVHDPISKSYAIDQIEDIERLRAVAHRMWEAFFAAHSQAAHIIEALMEGSCGECVAHVAGNGPGCADWQAWQVKVSAGFGTV